jgi:beta-fructofuranosidase
VQDLTVVPQSSGTASGIGGDSLEIIAQFAPGEATVGLKVRCSPGGEEETTILYDRRAGRLSIDRVRSSQAGDAEARKHSHAAPLDLAAGEPLRLDVYLDRSVLEVFANEQTCITTRIYPSRPDSLGIDLVAHGGGATLTQLDVWEMSPIW